MTWSRAKPRAVKYGKGWAKTRAAWAAAHEPHHLCTRCRRPLGPMGRWLHLDHDDHDDSVVRGFAHAACNVRAGAALGQQRQAATRGRQPRADAQESTRSRFTWG